MKIAVITENGKTISQHFGRAPYYLVFTIEDGKITNREMRDKMGHQHFVNEEHADDHGTAGHGMDSSSHQKHGQMAEAIKDCQVLLCGGMGRGAYVSMEAFNIRPIVAGILDIEEAVQAYLDGKLVDQVDRLH